MKRTHFLSKSAALVAAPRLSSVEHWILSQYAASQAYKQAREEQNANKRLNE
jgi:hypothetical protein